MPGENIRKVTYTLWSIQTVVWDFLKLIWQEFWPITYCRIVPVLYTVINRVIGVCGFESHRQY